MDPGQRILTCDSSDNNEHFDNKMLNKYIPGNEQEIEYELAYLSPM